MDAVLPQQLVERIAAQRVVGADEDGEIRVVGTGRPPVDAAQPGHAAQACAVTGIDARANGQRRIDMLQLQQAERGVDLTHLAVDARRHHRDFVHDAEVLELVDVALGLGVGADDGPALERVEDLGGMKAQAGQIAVAQHARSAGLAHAEGVGGVIDDLQAVPVGDGLDGRDIARVAVAMHRHDRGGLRRDGRLDPGRVHVERGGVDIDEHGRDAVPQQGVRGGHEGVGRGDDFARHTGLLQRRHQRQGAVGEQAQVLHSQIARQLGLQLRVIRAGVRQLLARPDAFQIGNEICERRQQRLGDGYQRRGHGGAGRVGR